MFLPKIVFFPQTSHSRGMPSPFGALSAFRILECREILKDGRGLSRRCRLRLLSGFGLYIGPAPDPEDRTIRRSQGATAQNRGVGGSKAGMDTSKLFE
jgi:hypothetical protein